jgi:inner membrane protein
METVNENQAQKRTTEKKSIKDAFQNSILIKLVIITALILLLLIPNSWIQSIIKEREQMNQAATEEVSEKWANAQRISGPILTIPLVYEVQKGKDTQEVRKNLKVLAQNLEVKGTIEPEKLKRGIYEVVVYRSDFNISGNFNLDGLIDSNKVKSIDYENAWLSIGISDLRGIKNNIKVKLDRKRFEVEPGTKIPELLSSGVMSKISSIEGKKQLNFDYQLQLNGSKTVEFIPNGGNTSIKIQSAWNAPSFNGKFLPDVREVNQDGFTAEWKILQLNKNMPTSWIDGNLQDRFNDSAFGVDLILPLDDYQKSMRSAKYAVLTIVLIFLVFFLVEIISKRRIHPFQYTLVGLALCLFYILLVSITEHLNFNLAYGIASLGIIGLIVAYSFSVFKKTSLSILLLFVLLALFGFLFTTLQLADFALLMGSVGLLIILAITMFSTRNINWYKLNLETKN